MGTMWYPDFTPSIDRGVFGNRRNYEYYQCELLEREKKEFWFKFRVVI